MLGMNLVDYVSIHIMYTCRVSSAVSTTNPQYEASLSLIDFPNGMEPQLRLKAHGVPPREFRGVFRGALPSNQSHSAD